VVQIPENVKQEMRDAAEDLPASLLSTPVLPGVTSTTFAEPNSKEDVYRQLIDNAWKAAFTIKGQHGIATPENAGNVVYKGVKFVCTTRLPPSVDGHAIADALKAELTRGDEYTFGAKI
jgi:hypothetical protein